ncbi:MAG: hypothetical protein IT381_15455 [Deltaproteobacteria bacterium]|nr:hypothetical protein [Deltaproteobacteria bacterium]
MREILIASAIAFGVAVGQLLLRVFSGQGLLGFGVLAIALGMAISFPAAIVYHLRLHATLGRRGELDDKWIWHPTRFHKQLRQNERRYVLSWFMLGVVGWVMALVGCGIALVSVI